MPSDVGGLITLNHSRLTLNLHDGFACESWTLDNSLGHYKLDPVLSLDAEKVRTQEGTRIDFNKA